MFKFLYPNGLWYVKNSIIILFNITIIIQLIGCKELTKYINSEIMIIIFGEMISFEHQILFRLRYCIS